MRYRIAALGLLAVAGGLFLWLALLHFDSGQAPAAQSAQVVTQSAPDAVSGAAGLAAGVQEPEAKLASGGAGPSCGGNAPGMADPAAVYCSNLGYTYQTVTNGEGQNGACVFPDGSSCDAWDFLEGKCGQSYSYCAKQGYGVTTKADGGDALSKEYGVCVQGQQEIGPVTELMGLSEKATKGMVPAGQSPLAGSEELAPPTASTAPSSFDWRNYNGQNWMTSVKDQGQCGSCWAFSAVGAAEPAFNIAANDPNLDLNLSEEYLVSDCHSAWGGQTCCGGWNDVALSFIEDNGIPDESCLPYVDASSCSCNDGCDSNCTYRTGVSCSDATCSNRCSDWSSRLTRISGTGHVSASAIKDTLVQKGPLSVCFGYGSQFGGNFDANGVYRCSQDTGTNHCVVLAGYDDPGGYWILKNSWGSSWNGNGYFKLGYGECTVENYVYYAEAPGTAPPTSTPTAAATRTPTRTATPTAAATRTRTPTKTRTATATRSPTRTRTPTRTATAVRSPTPTSTPTPVGTPPASDCRFEDSARGTVLSLAGNRFDFTGPGGFDVQGTARRTGNRVSISTRVGSVIVSGSGTCPLGPGGFTATRLGFPFVTYRLTDTSPTRPLG